LIFSCESQILAGKPPHFSYRRTNHIGTAGNNVDSYSLADILLHPCKKHLNRNREKNCHNRQMLSLPKSFFWETCVLK